MPQILTAMPTTTRVLRTLPILDLMRTIEGWLEDDEADLLLAAAARTLARGDGHPIVEIGSYCGRSTVVLASAVKALAPTNRVYAIDPHEGMVGALDQGLTAGAGTLERFRQNMIAAGVADVVEVIQRY
jgi:predicted O-methyltransferase YrrM